MKLGHLKSIKEALTKELEGIYHKRPEYEPAKENGKKKDKEDQ